MNEHESDYQKVKLLGLLASQQAMDAILTVYINVFQTSVLYM